MPVFFFDIDDGTGVVLDNEGSLHDDLSAAHREAVDTLSQIGRDVLTSKGDTEITVEIRDEAGNALMRTSLKLTSLRL